MRECRPHGRPGAGSTHGETLLTVKATLSPDDIARACAEAMWNDDDASKGLGMEIVEIKPGQATLAMIVQPHMVNGQRIAHGGFIFTLADSAFAFACNSHNERVVAAQGSITFIRPGRLGDRQVQDSTVGSRTCYNHAIAPRPLGCVKTLIRFMKKLLDRPPAPFMTEQHAQTECHRNRTSSSLY